VRPSPTSVRRAALAGLAAFVLTVALLHLVEPSLDPRRHVISEYANTPVGELMVVALLSWAGSLLATARWLKSVPRATAIGRLVPCLLRAAAVGLALAAVFRTQAVGADVPPGVAVTVTGRLHDLGSALSTLALFASAVAVSVISGRRSSVGLVSLALAALGLVVGVALLLVGDEVDGIRQRMLVAAACAWQAALLTMPNRSQVDSR
jgi:hypothetical protein